MPEKQDQPFPFFRNTSFSILPPALSAVAILLLCIFPLCAADLRLNDQDCFKAQGLSVLLFHNAYHGVFGDEKMSGVEIILHGERIATKNPYGVPIATSSRDGIFRPDVLLHKAFPEIIGPEYTLRGFDYVLGTHPVSNISFVSSVGTQSKLIAYGNNRADFTFIPGGIIPGVIIIQPDFPELKNAWPFLWCENEYVVDTVANYILAANAANAVAK